jgi:hypothetical protein
MFDRLLPIRLSSGLHAAFSRVQSFLSPSHEAPGEMPADLKATAEAMNAPSAAPKGRDLFIRNAPRAAHFTWPGKPTTVAAEKRRARKRRNRNRHKAQLRRRK